MYFTTIEIFKKQGGGDGAHGKRVFQAENQNKKTSIGKHGIFWELYVIIHIAGWTRHYRT